MAPDLYGDNGGHFLSLPIMIMFSSATATAAPDAGLSLFYIKITNPMISFYFSPMRSFTIGSIASAHNSYPLGLRWSKSGIITLEIVPSGFVNLSPMSR
jgi:hypothetical protein